MEPIRVGVVGVGNMGSAHAKNIFDGKVPGMALSAVCDVEPQKLGWAGENLPGVARFSDFEEMAASGLIDMVIVATPHYLHPPMGVSAFRHGLHVLVEKPAGVYAKQVEELNAAAKQSGKVFGIMLNQRMNPLYRKAREMVQSGALGEPKRCVWIITNWYRTQAYYDSGSWRATWAGEGGGVLLNQCPHHLDLWQWIFGMPKRIRGFCRYGRWHNIEVEDDVTAYAEYENGATGLLITSTGETPGTNRLEISGDKGKLVLEDGKLTFWELETPERELCFTSKDGFLMPNAARREILPEGEDLAHLGILTNFANAVLYGEKLIAPGYDGLNGLLISNAIHFSDWTGETVELPVDGDRFYEMLRERAAHSPQKAHVVSKISDLQGTYNDRWKSR